MLLPYIVNKVLSMSLCARNIEWGDRDTPTRLGYILTAANNFIFFVGFWMLTLIVMPMADYI